MKLVVTIDDDIYDDYLKQGATLPKYGTAIDSLYEALWNGVPLPDHHGRLIDADCLREDFKASKKISFAKRMDISCIVDHAPTIIEGSDRE